MEYRIRLAVALVLASLVTVAASMSIGSTDDAHGMAFHTHILGQPFADLSGGQGQLVRWNKPAIKYWFAPSFATAFPDQRLVDQVHLAFGEWQNAHSAAWSASESYHTTPSPSGGAANTFVDVRSLTVHELGHVVGLTHPNDAHGAASGLNYKLVGGTPVPSAPTGSEVMDSSLLAGEYNQILSPDERAAFQWAYKGDITFVETSSEAYADIVVKSSSLVGQWAHAYLTPAPWPPHPDGGKAIQSAVITFNASSSTPIGMRTRGLNWDFSATNGKPIRAISIRTQGTSNSKPLFHYDGYPSHRFGAFAATAPDPIDKDMLEFHWSEPLPGDIPATEIAHVGLELDTYIWTAEATTAHHPDGTQSTMGFPSPVEWNNHVVQATPPSPDVDAAGIGDGPAIEVLNRGIRIAAPLDISPTLMLSTVQLVDVDGLDLALEDLNAETLSRLHDQGIVIDIDLGPSDGVEIEAGDDYYLVLDGPESSLPENIASGGNYLMLPEYSDLLTGEHLVYVHSISPGGIVGTYALLGAPPITVRSMCAIYLPIACPEVPRGD